MAALFLRRSSNWLLLVLQSFAFRLLRYISRSSSKYWSWMKNAKILVNKRKWVHALLGRWIWRGDGSSQTKWNPFSKTYFNPNWREAEERLFDLISSIPWNWSPLFLSLFLGAFFLYPFWFHEALCKKLDQSISNHPLLEWSFWIKSEILSHILSSLWEKNDSPCNAQVMLTSSSQNF